MRVFIVTENYYYDDSERNIAAFSSLEEAERYVEYLEARDKDLGYGCDFYDVEEHNLDELIRD